MGRKNLLNYWAPSSEPRVTKCSNRIKWGKKCGKNSHILLVFNSKSSGSELTACPLLRLKEKSWKQPVTPPGRFDNSVFLSPDAKWVPLFVVKKVEGSFTFNCQELFRFSGIQNSHLYFLPTEKGLELGWLRDTIEDGIFIATRHTHTHTHTHTGFHFAICQGPITNLHSAKRFILGNDVNPSYRGNTSAKTQGC